MVRPTRRKFVATLAGTGLAGTAGCMGILENDDGPGDESNNENTNGNGSNGGGNGDLVFVSTGQGGALYPAAQGLGGAINEYTDEISINARPSDGSDANIGLLDRNEADIAMTSLWTWRNLRQNNEPFNQIDINVQQITHFLALGITPIAPHSKEWGSLSDMESGSALFPSPVGSGSARMVQYVLDEYITDDYEIVPTGLDGSASALAEGRIDLVFGGAINGRSAAPNVQEIGASLEADVLSIPVDELDEDTDLVISEADRSVFADLDGFVNVPDPLHMMDLTYSLTVQQGHNYDEIYEFVKSMHELGGDLGEYHAALAPFEDESHQVNAPMSEMPFHPAAADYYEEVGIWDDDTMIRGE